MTRIFFVMFFFVFSSQVLAQESSQGSYTHIEEGQVAPFSGVLLDIAALAAIIAKKELCEKETQLKLNFECDREKEKIRRDRDSAIVERDVLQKKAQLSDDIKEKEVERLRKIIDETNDFSSLWFAGGFIAGVGLSIAIFFISVQIVGGAAF